MAAEVYRHLTPGHTYSLVRGFTDHDGHHHQPDDYWRYLGYSFLPYEDGLTLFFISNRAEEKMVRLQHRPETEGAIIDALDSYFVEVDYPFLPAFASIAHVSDAGIESDDGRTVKAVSWTAIKRVTAAMGYQQYDMTLCVTIDHSCGKSIFFTEVDPFWPLFFDRAVAHLPSFTAAGCLGILPAREPGNIDSGLFTGALEQGRATAHHRLIAIQTRLRQSYDDEIPHRGGRSDISFT